jgi:PAS domain S-box-containing protein
MLLVSYIPHGHCYLWQIPLVGLHVTSDLLIAIAYFSIPIMLSIFARKRWNDVLLSRMLILFAAFIILCGAGHLLEIWTLWHPSYWIAGSEKAATAFISCLTAVQLVTVLPKFLALKTPEELENINQQLQQEIVERQKMEADLEIRVQERTAELSQAYAQLRQSQQLLQLVMDNIPQAVFWKDQTLRYMGCNRRFVRDLGLEAPEDILGCSDYNLYWSHAEAERFQHIDTQVIQLGTTVLDRPETIHRPDGSQIWLEMCKIPLCDVSGNVVGVLGTYQDISDRKRFEIALQKVVERERATARIIEQMRQSLDLESIFKATTQELRQAIECDRVIVYRFNPSWDGEIIAEAVGSGWRSLMEEQSEHADLTQQPLNHERCTARVLANTGIRIEDTYLQETQGEFYRQGIEYLPVEDIYAAGFDPCYVNLLERLQARAYLTVPIFARTQLWGLLACYQNSRTRQWEDPDIRMVVQVGSQLGVAIQQAELFAQTQQQAEELKVAKEAADTANLTKSEFLANMSHELRTPLNAILGFTQIMNRDDSLPPKHQNYVSIINRSGEHLLGLINNILEMSKIEAGQEVVSEEDFNLHVLLDNLREMLQLRAASKNLEFLIHRTVDLPHHIYADQGKLRQVLINLLSNAIKFTDQGTVSLSVSCTSSIQNLSTLSGSGNDSGEQKLQEQVNLCFAVQDTGPGIAPEEMEHLFVPFKQTHAGLKSKQGTGLGLPISQKYVQLMGGEITVESQIEQGATFQFTIPVKLCPPPQATDSSIQQEVIGLAPNQPEFRILVVEDNSYNRLLLMNLLLPLGFSVREAKNGKEAIEVWRDWQPHLIWMDMLMPEMDGYEATRCIRAEEKRTQEMNHGYSTKIIALTAIAFEEQRQSVLIAGCDDFVRKPFTQVELLQKLNQHLGVQFIYQSTVPLSDRRHTSSGGDGTSGIVQKSLSNMPSTWVRRLYYAAAQGSDQLVLELVQEIPANHSELVSTITHLTSVFQFNQILELVEPFLLAEVSPPSRD